MIRFNTAYCPFCMFRLLHEKRSNHFYCPCHSWARLKAADWLKEVAAAEKYDIRSTTFKG